jgi:hypothetical protein
MGTLKFDTVLATMVQHLNLNKNLAVVTIIRRCIAYYGATPDLVHSLWDELCDSNLLPEKGKLVHLLWSLAFLKTYCTYSKYSTDFSVHENTFIKWIWLFIPAIARMKHLVRIYIITVEYKGIFSIQY